MLWEHPGVEGITLWGWKPGMWRTDQQAYLVGPDGAERPALVWLREHLSAQLVATDGAPPLPERFQILGNYPDPFNPRRRYATGSPRPRT